MNDGKKVLVGVILLGLVWFYFHNGGFGSLSFVNPESDFSPLKGAEFQNSNLPVQYWNLKSGCYNLAGTPQPQFGTPSSGCYGDNKGSDWTVDTKQNKLMALSVARSPIFGGEIEYKGNIVGKDLLFTGEAIDPGTAILIHYANCDTLPGSSPGIGWGKNPGQFHADLLNTAFGSVKVLSSRLDPTKAQVFLNGVKVCDADHNLEPPWFKNKFTIEFVDTGLRGGPALYGPQDGGRVSINPILERIPFSCNINKGIGEVLVTENFQAGTPFDKFTLSYPAAKFCNNIGAFLYDPQRGFDQDSEVYARLNSGQSLTLPFDVKIAYIVRNYNPLTGQPYFADPNCGDGFGIDAKTLACKPLGGYVDLCRKGTLDVNRGACISKDTTICKGVIVKDSSGVDICEAFLPNLNQLCAPGTIVINGSSGGTCIAPKISCGPNHDLIQISLSEYSCVSKPGLEATPTTQEKPVPVQETDIITPVTTPVQAQQAVLPQTQPLPQPAAPQQPSTQTSASTNLTQTQQVTPLQLPQPSTASPSQAATTIPIQAQPQSILIKGTDSTSTILIIFIVIFIAFMWRFKK